ncbi:hypothetical protein BDW02DRAFT_577487 [Decorospora gaudefroyi]|uniref:Uncharacterized protein n=1 Tax=Decorospora gaudefroyi TaxID=184978 RepID=A0A6A5KRL8_9PLEO|nr:hypothetical protein BDW02DRAFT_577487 [Decorospora gaudefroyi]
MRTSSPGQKLIWPRRGNWSVLLVVSSSRAICGAACERCQVCTAGSRVVGSRGYMRSNQKKRIVQLGREEVWDGSRGLRWLLAAYYRAMLSNFFVKKLSVGLRACVPA